MQDFLFVYRNEYDKMLAGTPDEMNAMMKKWMEWLGSIAAQNKLTDKGNRLQFSGKVVKNNVVTNGPYIEIKESIGGYSIIKSASYEEAVEFAKACPILSVGGNVEVREINPV